MSGIAIRVASLSKLYHIGRGQGKAGYRTLRESMMDWAKAPLRWFSRDDRDVADDTIWALKDVSFEVKRGEVVGIIGRNGAGKSTLLKILSRITEPTEGTVDLYGRVGSLLEVGTGFHPELTGRENIYLNGAILGMKRTEIIKKFDEIVDFSEIEKFLDTPVKHYSSGMYVRLAFAVAAHLDPEILLVDEVLAVGDATFQKKCLGKMGEVAKQGRTVIFVSHNMEAILNLCPACFVLENGLLAFYGRSEDAVTFYFGAFSKQSSQLDAHVLYEGERNNLSQPVNLLRLEILDVSCQPKPFAYTWDYLIFRIHYVSDRDYQRGAFVLDIFDYKQQRLVVFDSGSRLPIERGRHYVDCIVPQLPLAAGEYYIGAGLYVSRVHWLWRKENLAIFHVHGKDVFELGRPPVAQRMIFVVDHKWNNQ